MTWREWASAIFLGAPLRSWRRGAWVGRSGLAEMKSEEEFKQASLLAFAIVANIADFERVPDENGIVHRGTKAFAPGAKITLGEWFWGTPECGGYGIGRNRVTGRMSKAVVPAFLLHNYRVQGIYSKSVLAKLVERKAAIYEKKEKAEELADMMRCASKLARQIDHGGKFTYLDDCDDHPRP